FPEAKHLVVAHSHGGTVAAHALDLDGGPGIALADGLLTLGTPFVRLMLRINLKKPSPITVLTGALLPLFSLCLAVLLALPLNFRAEPSVWLAVPVTIMTMFAVGLKN